MLSERLVATVWPWGVNTREAAELASREVSEIGYKNIESTKATMYAFDLDHRAYADMLSRYGQRAVSFYFHIASYGNEEETFKNLERELNFAAELGAGVCLQASWGRPEVMDERATEYELSLIEKFCTAASAFGIKPSLHPHYNTWAMYENEIDTVFSNIGRGLLGFAPDTAHIAAAGGNPLRVIERHIDRVTHTHFKDITAPVPYVPSDDAPLSSRFCELGRGCIDHKPIFALLREGGYSGYLCEELDKSRIGNAASAKINYDYILENY